MITILYFFNLQKIYGYIYEWFFDASDYSYEDDLFGLEHERVSLNCHLFAGVLSIIGLCLIAPQIDMLLLFGARAVLKWLLSLLGLWAFGVFAVLVFFLSFVLLFGKE